ncbi:unnamed protein product [Haemonchus placei]|uniref:Ig-like domain-containing protein n=1 Tax=Haemonchus placei TaxID=6290 RepID=A0A3P7X239_HAEPC|nr:unnamed protein product [Haemonchus placei]
MKKQYEDYRLCIKRRESLLSEANYVQVVLSIKDSVSPENAIEIESTYKPSAGSIGRAFIAAFDFFKEKILRSTNKIRDVNKWKYDWQRAIMGQDWRLLTKMHETVSYWDFRFRFLARDNARIRVGDRYELRITNVDRNITGYYRCVNKHGRNRVVSAMYYLDVISRANIKMVRKFLKVELRQLVTYSKRLSVFQLTFFVQVSPWSECSKCGEEIGEQARRIQCMIEVRSVLPSCSTGLAGYAILFPQINCFPSILPLNLAFFLKRACTTQVAVDRNLTSVDELGETRVLDYIPKGEFLFGEILPRLLAPVVRRNYLVRLLFQTTKSIFRCWWLLILLGGPGSNFLCKLQGRFLFDEFSRLYITKLEMEDSDEYFCYTSEKVLMGVHYLRVLENDRTREYVANIEMFFRFAAFTFIFVLMIGQVMK